MFPCGSGTATIIVDLSARFALSLLSLSTKTKMARNAASQEGRL
jgi:hypothetical protein